MNVCGHAQQSTLATKRPMHKYDVYPTVALWLSKQNCSYITSTSKKRNRVHGTNTPTQNMSTYALNTKRASPRRQWLQLPAAVPSAHARNTHSASH